ncbi:hypothetical protein VTN00DRAFT_623 [Thermoascus crustaceus]|uniref:uncharacterized protein n=1 Tax=Thermoascus crustaceus TaxID=5088 RepID=UPI0037437477
MTHAESDSGRTDFLRPAIEASNVEAGLLGPIGTLNKASQRIAPGELVAVYPTGSRLHSSAAVTTDGQLKRRTARASLKEQTMYPVKRGIGSTRRLAVDLGLATSTPPEVNG